MQGKIIKGIAGFYYIYAEDGNLYECKARGNLRNKKITPLVGDDVDMVVTDVSQYKGSLESIQKRNNSLIRPAVANVDQALIFFARNNPEPNMGLVDRLLITMEKLDIPCIIAFNKSDLQAAGGEDFVLEQEAYRKAGYTVLDVCVSTGEGIDELKELLVDKTTTLAGPSGAGKSSLINLLCPDAAMETGTVSDKLGRGRHTTRHAEILVMQKDSFIVDTPGFTSFELFDIEPEDLSFYYPEFAEFAGCCKFNTCSHTHEPGCAVVAAVEDGELSRLRYDRYAANYEELKLKKKYQY